MRFKPKYATPQELSELLRDNDLSFDDAAKILNVSRQFIGQCVRGYRNFNYGYYRELQSALGLSNKNLDVLRAYEKK